MTAVQFGADPAKTTLAFGTMVVSEEVMERRAVVQTAPSTSVNVKAMAEEAVLTVVVFAVMALKVAASSTAVIVRAAERVVELAEVAVTNQLKLALPL